MILQMLMPHDSRAGALAAAAAIFAALFVSACGGESDDGSATPKKASAPPAQKVDPNKDPHAITCRDLADKAAASPLIRPASVKLANEARLENVSALQAWQRIAYAMTELCEKSKDMSYKPAKDAVKAVRQGKYVTGTDDEQKYVGD